jgi:MFS transporter, MHS family, shikimate and dehydroshikimate transport protein
MTAELVIRDAATERKGGMTSVVLAGSIGTIIEWYDFLIYGTAAALVFNTLFFPTIDPLA